VGCANHVPVNVLSLPELPRSPIKMRVAYVINPRLPQMDSAQVQLLLEAITKTSREHFGVDLRFDTPVEIPIDAWFGQIPSGTRQQAFQQVYDFKTGKGDPVRFEKAFVAGLKANADTVADVMQYARPYLEAPVQNTYEALGAALAKLQLRRVEQWKSVKALDGGPAMDASPYNEFVMWTYSVLGSRPFELVITNQIIASVEYVAPAAHAALRGGYSNGVTTYNPLARFKTTSIWSTFAFSSEDPWLVQMRGGESYEPSEAAQLAGIAAAHEIGHQLFHLGHPYANAACLMNPVPLFAFRAWANGLSPQNCPMGGSPSMRPGVIKFYGRGEE
ncbi:MAG: hypothetical protein FD131_4554, partial [Rhodocyclaceae bacterium]